jgi:hypothetical protein
VDLSTVPETVALSKTLVAAKAVDPAPGPDISEEDTPLDGR